MNVIALIGDCTTTTSLAIAAAWPAGRALTIVEADRGGGSLAAWLDTPRSPTISSIVAHVRSGQARPSWESIEPFVHHARSGTRFIAAPVHSLEANRAIAEANTSVFPLITDQPGPTLLADLGRHAAAAPIPKLAELASSIVVCHRQRVASPAAAGVRLERCAELVESLSQLSAPIRLAVIGDRPFDIAEIGAFVIDTGRRGITTHLLADDPLAAAALAGRTGVSARRLARLPLSRSARELVAALAPVDEAAEPITGASIDQGCASEQTDVRDGPEISPASPGGRR